jgi:hypothetical protein
VSFFEAVCSEYIELVVNNCFAAMVRNFYVPQNGEKRKQTVEAEADK